VEEEIARTDESRLGVGLFIGKEENSYKKRTRTNREVRTPLIS